jgi:GAF domain-containing protein
VDLAHQQGQVIVDLSQQLGASFSLQDLAAVMSVRVKALVSYDAMALYVVNDELLTPAFVTGDNFRLFSSLRIPVGEGLSGWVAQNRRPILNGNPSVEPGYLNDASKYSTLRSGLAVPLMGSSGVIAVLALYRIQQDAFRGEDLRILLALAPKLGAAIENVLRDQAGNIMSASTGFSRSAAAGAP